MRFAGCEDAAKRPVQAHAPALEPQQTQQAHVAQGAQAQPMQARGLQAAPTTIGSRPLWNPKPPASTAPTPPAAGASPSSIDLSNATGGSGTPDCSPLH